MMIPAGRVRRRLALTAVLGLCISAISINLLASRVGFGDLPRLLSQADIALVGLAVVSLGMGMVLRTVRWKVIFPTGRAGVRAGTVRLAPVVLIGYALNALVPMRLGDVVRGALAAKRFRVGIPEALGSVGLERIVDVAALAGVALVVSARTVLPSWLMTGALAMAAIGVVALVGLQLSGRMERRIHARATKPGMVRRFWTGLLSDPRAVVLALVAGGAAWCVDGVTVWVIAHALGLSVPWEVAMLIGVGSAIGAILPSAPAAIGTFHLAGTSAGVALGLDPSSALALVTLWHAVTVVSLVAGGLLSASALGLSQHDLRRLWRHDTAPEVSPSGRLLNEARP